MFWIPCSFSRCDMAQMMYNILLDKGAPLPSAAECQAAQSRMGDWSRIPARYQEAVRTCYALGLLNGQKDGTFAVIPRLFFRRSFSDDGNVVSYVRKFSVMGEEG